jgi:hypothetical protein
VSSLDSPKWRLTELVAEHIERYEDVDPPDCDICRRVDFERMSAGIPSIFG